MKEVRLGVIGCGGMARGHMEAFARVPGLRFVAAADPSPHSLKLVTDKHSVQTFDDGMKLLDSGLVDAVFIGTPHYQHPTYSIAALKRDLHVLTEKPVAVTALAAEEMIKASAGKPKLAFGAMFQLRTMPLWRTVKDLIDSDALGAIRRLNWIITTWFRSQAYYDSGSWRATWAGEGGGVLLNQCPHQLDLLTWLAGSPSAVQAHVSFGKYHDIEVEDDVTAYLEYANGATGVFITSTGEAPGTNRLEITGDNGKLVVEHDTIVFHKSRYPIGQYIKTTPEPMTAPPSDKITYEICGKGEMNLAIFRNFIDSILHPGRVKLIAPATEGIKGLELGNAMVMSGLSGKKVSLPTDRRAYDRLLKKLIKSAKTRKQRSPRTGVGNAS